MSAVEFALSQGPMFQDYAEMVRAYWNTSRHPGNLEDIREAASESLKNMRPYQGAILAGVLALEAFELSPGNETLLVEIGTNHFTESGGQDVVGSALRVGATTLALETTLGLGFVYGLSKFRPVIDILRKRYVPQAQTIEEQAGDSIVVDDQDSFFKRLQKRTAKAVKVWGLALTTGASGATAIEDLTEGPSHEQRTKRQNKAFAIAAAGLLAVNNTSLGGAILQSKKSDIPVMGDIAEGFLDITKNPMTVLGIFSGLYAYKALREQQATKARLAARDTVSEEAVFSHETISPASLGYTHAGQESKTPVDEDAYATRPGYASTN